MLSIGRTISVWLGVVVLCGVAANGSARAASEEVKVTGCLTDKGKLKRLEFIPLTHWEVVPGGEGGSLPSRNRSHTRLAILVGNHRNGSAVQVFLP